MYQKTTKHQTKTFARICNWAGDSTREQRRTPTSWGQNNGAKEKTKEQKTQHKWTRFTTLEGGDGDENSRAEENTKELRIEQWNKGENRRGEDSTKWRRFTTLGESDGNEKQGSLLPQRVSCYRLCAMPVQHMRTLEQAQRRSSPEKNTCDKQVSSWRHISCHTDKNRYYTWS